MFTLNVDEGNVKISAKGDRKIVLAEALSCINVSRDFLMKHMDISKEEAIFLIIESITE